MTAPSLGPPAPAGFRKWAPLLVLSLALAIIIIDTTLLNVSLSTLIRELHTDLKSLQWVISAYSLTLAALTVTGGRMGDLFGRKKMFMAGALLFAIGSFIASISRSVPMLLAGESIIEGIGAALMMPATASLLISKYRGHDRALAFGVWGGVAAAASAIGPIVGGFLTTHYSWRWGFRINVVVVAVLLAGARLITDETRRVETRAIDWVGVLLSSSGLFLVVFSIIESSAYGWFVARETFPLFQPGRLSVVPLFLLGGLTLLSLFAFWELRLERAGSKPIVSMRLFRNRQFVSGALVIGVLMLGMNGIVFSIPVFLQSVRNLDAFHTGLTLLPMSVMLLIISPAAAALVRRFPHKWLVQAGLALDVVALLILSFSLSPSMSLLMLIPGLALYGTGQGLVMSQINNVALSAVPVEEAGEASGVVNTFRQIGAALGAAIIGAVLLSTIVSQVRTEVTSNSALTGAEKQTIAMTVAHDPSELAFGGAHLLEGLSPAGRAEMSALRRDATTSGSRRALLYGAAFALLGLAISTRLPATVREHPGQTPRE